MNSNRKLIIWGRFITPTSQSFLRLKEIGEAVESGNIAVAVSIKTPGENAESVFYVPSPDCDRVFAACAGDDSETLTADEYYCRSREHFGAGRIGNAIEDLSKAVDLKPDFPEAIRELGSLHLTTGQIKEAVLRYGALVKLLPGDAEAHFALATSYDQAGRVNNAMAEYVEAIKIMPGYVEAYLRIGLAFEKKMLFDEAIWVYTKAVRFSPEYGEAYLGLGRSLLINNALNEAGLAFKTASCTLPDSEEAHYGLGLIYYRQGYLLLAIKELEVALKINPNHWEAMKKMQAVMDSLMGIRRY